MKDALFWAQTPLYEERGPHLFDFGEKQKKKYGRTKIEGGGTRAAALPGAPLMEFIGVGIQRRPLCLGARKKGRGVGSAHR